MKKDLISLTLIIFLLPLFLATSCARRAEDQRLSVSMSLSEEEWKVMKEGIFPEFERRYRRKIEATQIEASDLPTILEAHAQAQKSEIDVFCQDNMQLALLVNKDLVEDLSPYRGKIPKEVPQNLISVGEFEGSLYFMPYRPNVQITYYNIEAFKKYNLFPPKSWDELFEVAKFFKEKEGIGRVLFKAWGDGPTTAQIYEFIVSAGGSPFLFNDQGCIQTFTFLQKLYPYLSPESPKAKWNTSNDYMARESVYLMQNWPFGVKVIIKDYGKKNIATYSGWAGPKREAHVVGGEVMGIPKSSKNKDLALKFISYMQSKKVQEKLVRFLGWPSIREDAFSKVEDWLAPHFESVKKALRHGVFRKNVPYWSDFDRYLNEAFIKIVIRGEPVKKTLDYYAQKMKEVESRAKVKY